LYPLQEEQRNAALRCAMHVVVLFIGWLPMVVTMRSIIIERAKAKRETTQRVTAHWNFHIFFQQSDHVT